MPTLRTLAVLSGLAVSITSATDPGLVPPAKGPVTVTVRFGPPGPAIPPDFVGLSFETKRMLADPTPPGPATRPTTSPPRLFDAGDVALVCFFRTLDVRSLRVGGNTAERASVPLPTRDDIDALFAFATEAGVRVIYTLRLQHAEPAVTAETARYVHGRYGPQLSSFEIGNEPDAFYPTFEAYAAALHATATAVSTAAPGAALCGPSTTQAHPDWPRRLREPALSQLTQHAYPGGNGQKATDPTVAVDRLLSPERVGEYAKLADVLLPAAHGPGVRLEETNSFYLGGAAHASDAFGSALWALDYLHWWAARGAAGLNFHTSDFYPVTPDGKATWYVAFAATADRRGYAAKPLAYALAAFAAATPARSVPVTLDGAAGANVTAYATLDAAGRTCLTVINKSHGVGGRTVTLSLPHGWRVTARLDLVGPSVLASEGVTLGGAAIASDGAWNGSFEARAATDVAVLPASATVLRLNGN